MMALFGLLWVMRVRAEVRKDKRRQVVPRGGKASPVLLSPPVPFADAAAAAAAPTPDDEPIPPPPPPPRLAADAHRSRPLRTALRGPLSRSAHNLTLECTCPVGRRAAARRAACVRFCDDPLGFYSARGHSSHYASVLSTLPRRPLRRCRPLSASAQGLSPSARSRYRLNYTETARLHRSGLQLKRAFPLGFITSAIDAGERFCLRCLRAR